MRLQLPPWPCLYRGHSSLERRYSHNLSKVKLADAVRKLPSVEMAQRLIHHFRQESSSALRVRCDFLCFQLSECKVGDGGRERAEKITSMVKICLLAGLSARGRCMCVHFFFSFFSPESSSSDNQGPIRRLSHLTACSVWCGSASLL